MPKKEKPYDKAADVLRIIAIIAVVVIHTTTRTIQVSNNDLARFSFSLFLNQAARFAVPMFFLISGFVLELSFHFNKSYVEYLKKRVSKIFIPYVAWSLFYYLIIFKNQSENILSALTNGTASYQLYFIPSLFIFYLIFPFIHQYYKVIAKPKVLATLGILQIVILTYDYFFKPLPPYLPISVAVLNYFVFLLGMFMARNIESVKALIVKWRWFAITSTILLAFLIFLEGKERYLATQNYLSFYSQWRPSVLIYTVFLSGVLYQFFNRSKISPIVIKKIANLSFFVFFVHVSILEAFWKIAGNQIYQVIQGSFVGRIIFDPFVIAIVAIYSFLLAEVAHKIPKLPKLSG